MLQMIDKEQHKTAERHVEDRWRYAVPITVICLLAIGVGLIVWRTATIRDWLGELSELVAVDLNEAHQKKPAGASFDHSLFNDVLKKHVDKNGWVDYRSLKKNTEKLDQYIAKVKSAPFRKLGRNEKLALLINAYNAFTLKLILDYHPVKSIMDIPEAKRWQHRRWNIGGNVWSLDQIEHKQIRPRFKEPRIHFALVCAAVGCPPLRNEAFVAAKLNKQLEGQAKYVHGHKTWFRFDNTSNRLQLTKLYDWYGGDFTQVAGTVPAYAARYSKSLKQALRTGAAPRIGWLKYDWDLNSVQNKQPR